MSVAISSHGTLVKRNSVTIGELRDITPPALTRNTFETSNQADSDESFVVGIRRRGDLQFTVNWLQSGETTHGTVSGLLKAFTDGSKDLWTVTFPDGSAWNASGFLTNLAIKSPVEGEQSADVTVKLTNAMTMTP